MSWVTVFRYVMVLLAPLLGAGAASGQDSVRAGEPDTIGLAKSVRRWSANSSLGDLGSQNLDRQDIELRFWSGFGLFGERGLLLRRREGEWSAAALELQQCFVPIPPEVRGDSSALGAFKAAVGTADCEPYAQGRVIQVDTVLSHPVPDTVDVGSVWAQLVALGLLEIRPDYRPWFGWKDGRPWVRVVLDGHHYVLETHVSGEYRSVYVAPDHPDSVTLERLRTMETLLYERLQPDL